MNPVEIEQALSDFAATAANLGFPAFGFAISLPH